MTKQQNIKLYILAFLIGWCLNAVAWTIAGPHPINTIFLIAGIGGFISGLIWLLISIFKN